MNKLATPAWSRNVAIWTARAAILFSAAALSTPLAAQTKGQPEAEVRIDANALARAAQNPIAAMISVPFQNNTNFNVGPLNGTQNILNIQPVIPIGLTPTLNLITRTIIPVVSQPAMQAGNGTTFGLGSMQLSAFISPAQPGPIIWGAGAVVQAPTATRTTLGSNLWGGGPTAVALTMQGPWVLGGLVNNIWSFSQDNPSSRYNIMTFQPFINYNFPKSPGTYLSFSPLITSNWEARSGQQLTVPLGLSIGQIFKIGSQPFNAQVGAYYNVVRPDNGPEWQLRFQISLMFPK